MIFLGYSWGAFCLSTFKLRYENQIFQNKFLEGNEFEILILVKIRNSKFMLNFIFIIIFGN